MYWNASEGKYIGKLKVNVLEYWR